MIDVMNSALTFNSRSDKDMAVNCRIDLHISLIARSVQLQLCVFGALAILGVQVKSMVAVLDCCLVTETRLDCECLCSDIDRDYVATPASIQQDKNSAYRTLQCDAFHSFALRIGAGLAHTQTIWI